MPRPVNKRQITAPPPCQLFKPAGIPVREIAESIVTVDEYEAMRLADYEGLYQEQVAEKLGVSRQTVGRILQSGRKKVAQALVEGLALRIEGGEYVTRGMRQFACSDCGFGWELKFDGGHPESCPSCRGNNFQKAERICGRGRRGRGRCNGKNR